MSIFYSKYPKRNGQNQCKRQSKPDASILPYHQESDYYLYNVRNLIVRIGFIDRSPTQDYGQAPSKWAGRQPRQQSGRKAVAASSDGGSRQSDLRRAAWQRQAPAQLYDKWDGKCVELWSSDYVRRFVAALQHGYILYG